MATTKTKTPRQEVSIPDPAETGVPTPAAVPTPAPDPFDPARLRLSQDMMAAAGVKKLLTTLPVRKPSKEWFVRVRPEAAYRLSTFVVELKEDAETYLVDPDLWSELAGETTFSPRMLMTAINRQGTLFLWPVRLPGADGKIDTWSRSAMDAAEYATKQWVRVQSNMSLGAYEVLAATADLPEPEWPTTDFRELLRVAFRDRHITSADHPVIQRLRGQN